MKTVHGRKIYIFPNFDFAMTSFDVIVAKRLNNKSQKCIKEDN